MNIQKIKENLLKNKEFKKNFKKLNYYTVDNFISDAISYIKAIKEGRMINCIGHVSSSGMYRTIRFMSCCKHEGIKPARYSYRQYYCLFVCLGYSESRSDRDYFLINGCGMDMIFNTNYCNIHNFERMGFINKKECDYLAQQTPTTI